MDPRPFFRVLASLLALCLLALAGANAATAKEESKIQIRLQPPGVGGARGNGVGAGQVRGDVRTVLQGDIARLQLRVRGAAANTEYVLLAKDDAMAMAGDELARFTTGPKGQWNGSVDLAKGDGAQAPTDPRGRYLVVSDGVEDILAGWLYGAPEDDGPMTKVKELTGLEPDAGANPTGSVGARYDRRPNGIGTFRVSLRGVPTGDYDLWVDGLIVGSLTPNSGGNADAKFTTKPFHGTPHSAPHNTKQQLSFDPRRKQVELKQGAQLFFSGPMLAQIEGVNTCTSSASVAPFALGPGQSVGAGAVTLSIGADCETSLGVQVEDLPAASYDLYVDGALVGAIAVADDGMGNLAGSVAFDPTPDAPGELMLDFPVGSGSVVEVFAAGESAPAATPLLTATLP